MNMLCKESILKLIRTTFLKKCNNSTQSSKKTNQNCPTYLSTFPQSRAPKEDQNTPMES